MKQFLKRILDRPGLRPVLGLIASFYSLIRPNTSCSWIYYKDGVWVHKRQGGVIVDRKINYEASLVKFQKVKNCYEFVYNPKYGDVIVHAGAGIGIETHYFSKAVGPNGKVVAIEAHPQTFHALCQFCQYNKLDNVILVNVAIGSEESDCLIDNNEHHMSSTILGTKTGTKVTCTPLDLLVEKLQIPTIDCLLMNIEGAEKLAIVGMSKSIVRTKYVCIACHDFRADIEGIEEMRTKETVRQFLIGKNFNLVSRDSDERVWIRDQLNGMNKNFPS